MDITQEHYASVYDDLDREAEAAARAARAELPCSECGSADGMQSGWDREMIRTANIFWAGWLYSCKGNDHELYTPCHQCNPDDVIVDDFALLTPEQVAAWLARECQCPDCERERSK